MDNVFIYAFGFCCTHSCCFSSFRFASTDIINLIGRKQGIQCCGSASTKQEKKKKKKTNIHLRKLSPFNIYTVTPFSGNNKTVLITIFLRDFATNVCVCVCAFTLSVPFRFSSTKKKNNLYRNAARICMQNSCQQSDTPTSKWTFFLFRPFAKGLYSRLKSNTSRISFFHRLNVFFSTLFFSFHTNRYYFVTSQKFQLQMVKIFSLLDAQYKSKFLHRSLYYVIYSLFA